MVYDEVCSQVCRSVHSVNRVYVSREWHVVRDLQEPIIRLNIAQSRHLPVLRHEKHVCGRVASEAHYQEEQLRRGSQARDCSDLGLRHSMAVRQPLGKSQLHHLHATLTDL